MISELTLDPQQLIELGQPFDPAAGTGLQLSGADRDALFIAVKDADALGLTEGAAVTVRSETGEVAARIRISRVRAGNVQMFFPEANPLLRAGQRDPIALVPDYNAVVEIIPA